MDKILHDLGELLLKAVPTFLLVWLLYFYLKRVFFRPLEGVLAQRRQATEGTRKLAEETSARASEKVTQYEAALRAARAEIYQERETLRQQWGKEHAAALEEARGKAEGLLYDAGMRLTGEVAEAEHDMDGWADYLAAQITGKILAGRAS